VDDEYIQELLDWEDPGLGDAECIFTESENMTMLNLPRKECERYFRSISH
jgi:protein SHQ1